MSDPRINSRFIGLWVRFRVLPGTSMYLVLAVLSSRPSVRCLEVTFGNSVLMICCPLPLFRVYEAAAAAVWPAVLLYIHSHTLYISVDAIRRGKNQEQRSFNSSDLIYTTTSRGTINLYVRVSTRIHFIRTSRSTKLRVLLVSILK